eukprot:1155561-Pelagomonas_calceolata.AAC.3
MEPKTWHTGGLGYLFPWKKWLCQQATCSLPFAYVLFMTAGFRAVLRHDSHVAQQMVDVAQREMKHNQYPIQVRSTVCNHKQFPIKSSRQEHS